MKSMWRLIALIITVGFLLISTTLRYWGNGLLSSYYIPIIFVLLMVIIFSVFEFREYYNKKLYLTVTVVVLGVMWTLSFIQPLSPGADKMIYFIETGLATLGIIAIPIDLYRKSGKDLNLQKKPEKLS